MKKLTLVTIVILLHLGNVIPINAQNAPCLRVNTDTWANCPSETDQNNQVNILTNFLSFNIAESGADLDPNPGARYKAFWMFGDGNYRWFPYGTPEQDARTLQQNYIYENTGAYSPVVVLSERKSNTKPPKKPKRNINVENMVAPIPSGGNFVPDIPEGRSMNIFNHDYNRPYYPTVFVVSAKPVSGLSQVYLFYNSKYDGSAGYSPLTIHNQLEEVFLPNYLPSNLGRNNATTAPATFPTQLSDLQTILGSRFANFLVVSAENGWAAKSQVIGSVKGQDQSGLIELPAEIRIFPSLVSTWDNRWINAVTRDTLLPRGHYLALAVGTTPHPSLDPNQPNVIGPLAQEVRQYFPDINTSNLQCGTGFYIQGIATADVDMVASIDPNGLTILEICPLENNKYKVKIRMEVCNEGYMHEQNFALSLIDHTGQIGKPNFIGGKAPKFENAAGNAWNYTWEVFLDGVPMPSETAESRAQARKLCETAEFEVETNWDGVQKLAKGEGLELCVKFLHAREECTKNYKVDDAFCKKCGLSCTSLNETCQCQDWNCTPMLIGLLIILLIILIWWVLKGRQNTGTAP